MGLPLGYIIHRIPNSTTVITIVSITSFNETFELNICLLSAVKIYAEIHLRKFYF